MRSKSSLKKKDYNEFIKFSSDSDDPLVHMHTQAEGTVNYTTLFYT